MIPAQAQTGGGDFGGQLGRRIAHGDWIQAVFFQQGDQAAPVDLAAAGRQGGDVDHGDVVFEEVGGTAGHFSEGGVESDAVSRRQNGGDGDDGGNLDFYGLLKQALGHGRQYQWLSSRACAGTSSAACRSQSGHRQGISQRRGRTQQEYWRAQQCARADLC